MSVNPGRGPGLNNPGPSARQDGMEEEIRDINPQDNIAIGTENAPPRAGPQPFSGLKARDC